MGVSWLFIIIACQILPGPGKWWRLILILVYINYIMMIDCTSINDLVIIMWWWFIFLDLFKSMLSFFSASNWMGLPQKLTPKNLEKDLSGLSENGMYRGLWEPSGYGSIPIIKSYQIQFLRRWASINPIYITSLIGFSPIPKAFYKCLV